MMNLQLLHFIVYNFVQAHIASVTVFNCWQLEMRRNFAELALEAQLYTQYINVDRIDVRNDLEWSYLRHKQPMLGIFLDMSCGQAERMMNMSSELKLYNAHYHWLIYDGAGKVSDLQRLFGNANLSVDAQLNYAMPSSVESNAIIYTTYDVYNNGRQLGGKLNITIDKEIRCDGEGCELGKFLSKLHERTKYGNRCMLQDITMTVSTVVTKRPLTLPENELQAFLLSDNNTFVDAFARYGFHTLQLKRDSFKCNFTYIYTDRWSSTEVQGGTVGDLIDERAQLTSTSFLVTARRLYYTSALTETGGFRSVCIFRTPRNAGIHGGVFLQPFSVSVWIIFCVVLAIGGVMLWKTFRIEHNRMRQQLSFMPSLLATLLIAFGSACFQGTQLVPCSTGGRMAFFTLSLITFLMYNYYTSIVVSSLLGTPVKSNIKTMGQLADSSLDVGLEPLPFTFVYLNSSTVSAVRRFVRRKIESNPNAASVWLPVDVGLHRVRNEPGYVFVFEASTGYTLIEKFFLPHEICDLNEILLRPDLTLHTHTHRNSSYKEFVRFKETRMLETGTIRRYRRYWIREHLNCFASNYVISVGMEYAAPLFFLLLCAYVVALLVLLAERCHRRYYCAHSGPSAHNRRRY